MKNIPKPLTDKDFRILDSAFNNQKEYTIERTLGDYSIQISVEPASPSWNQPMLFQTHQSRRLVSETKNCASISELQAYLGYK